MSPESPRGEPRPEHEPLPYTQAARFAGEQPAAHAYAAAQDAIYTGPPNDLSVFRFRLNQVWHVAALGLQPPSELAQALTAILAAGEPATLPDDLWQLLTQRRQQATRLGPWVERHERPES
jgi:hypothetical protein